jgi:hypothetical protein
VASGDTSSREQQVETQMQAAVGVDSGGAGRYRRQTWTAEMQAGVNGGDAVVVCIAWPTQ